MNDKYKQVSCNFYDQLENFATLHKKLKITYLTIDAETRVEEGFIKTLVTRNKAEYLITESEMEIRLDKLVSIVEV